MSNKKLLENLRIELNDYVDLPLKKDSTNLVLGK